MPGNTAKAAVLLSVFLMSIVHCGHSEEGVCTKSDDGVKCSEDNSVRLTRLNGELVGNVQTITDGDRKLEMKTLNMKPLVFEIENFLTEEECDYIKAAAVKTGLESSQTMAHSMSKNQNVDLMDLNHDGELDIKEMKITIENGYDIFLEKEDILDMYSTLELDTNGDTHISREELSKIKPKDLFTYLHKVGSRSPREALPLQ
ncbi:hypothetical protein DPMN_086157 [Dreissena polymorpha]|uniref:Uncharacterized protein n=1 Tax=Dreissena polymorpha TaxID=45954 RepID=A0A9D3YIA7_DREPO|nr:hypothetical protein DPMN_086157 [Dreissena polymorpha]